MEPVKMLRIPADMSRGVELVDAEPTLELFQREVGGFVEAVRIPGAVIWVDEEGKLKGKPMNPRATALARIGRAIGADFLAGDTLVVGYSAGSDTYRSVPGNVASLVDAVQQIALGTVHGG